MEANEAPEKIILSADRDTQIINDEWVINDYTDNIKIEYVRKDAFIEKTEKFMNTVNEYLYHCVSEECDYVDTDKFIEEFRKYIKGE